VKLPFPASGSRITIPPAAELRSVPKRLLASAAGIIGMEMATVYSTRAPGSDVVEMLEGLMPGTDRDLVAGLAEEKTPRFDRVMLKTKTPRQRREDGSTSSSRAPAGRLRTVLVSVGRSPQRKSSRGERGRAGGRARIHQDDKQMRTNVQHIFAIGDIAVHPCCPRPQHEGTRGGAAGGTSVFDARCIRRRIHRPGDCLGGETEETLKGSRDYDKAVFPWTASGRALANAARKASQALFDKATQRVIGAHRRQNAGELIAEICLAIEMGRTRNVGKPSHPTPR